MKPPIEVLLHHVAKDLRQAGARFAVVGALAVGAHTGPRFTRDVDLAIATTSDAEAEHVLTYMIRYGYRPVAELDQKHGDRLLAMRLIAPYDVGADPDEGQPIADIICRLCGIEQETVADATDVCLFPGLVLPTAKIPHLIAMKLVSESDHRHQDRADLQALIAVATPAEIAEVERLLDLVTARGYARDKDLHVTFRRFRGRI